LSSGAVQVRRAGRLVPVLRFRAGTMGWKARVFPHISARTNAAGPKPAHRKDRKRVVKGKSVDLGGRRIIEKEPDEVLVVWSGAPTEDPGIGSDVRTLAELWAALADDAPMPPALAELALHVGDRPLGILGPSATDWIRAAEHRQGFCDRDFLKSPASACSLGGGLENDYTLCVNDQWDGIEGSADPTYVSTAVVCPNLGDVVLHFYAPDAYGLWPVPLNTYWQGTHTNFGCIKASDPGCHYNTHTVEDAEGDRFHFRMIADLAE
ncbi:MAG: hypothetical protein KC420_18550, partial [Myxococcales bacterium]|nr:hypothetical protein [Myxococcales bacterium]